MTTKRPEMIEFKKTTPKRTAPNDPKNPMIHVAECRISHYDPVSSMVIATFRDGIRVYDMALLNYGVSKRDGKLLMKFQFHGGMVFKLPDHEYRVHAKIHFMALDGK